MCIFHQNMENITILTICAYSVGAIQGIVFGSILFLNKGSYRIANKLLAFILFLFSYRLIIQIMRLFGIGYYDSWYYIMLDLSWINGALLYFYVLAQITPNFKLKRKDWIHFIPLLIQIICSVFVRLQNIYWDGTKESLSWLGYWGYVVWMNNATIYIIASSLIIFYAIKAEKAFKQQEADSSIVFQNLTWLKRIILSFKVYFALILAIIIIDQFVFNIQYDTYYFYFTRFYYYPFFLGIAILNYWLGIEGLRRKDAVSFTIKQKIPTSEKEKLEEIAAAIKLEMEEKQLYRNPELSINLLADTLAVKPYLISKSLNEIFDKKFTDYINEYRVKEVKKLIANPDNDKYTLLGLAMTAGFNSKSSFNRAVNKQLGISPNELRQDS